MLINREASYGVTRQPETALHLPPTTSEWSGEYKIVNTVQPSFNQI